MPHTCTIPTLSFRPCYNTHKTWQENLEAGPEGNFEDFIFEKRNDKSFDFLGYSLASPLGVPAGPLLNSKWIAFASKMGFDFLTYKTIRASSHPSHPLPNCLYVKPNFETNIATAMEKLPNDFDELAITNSFGNPSMDPAFLLEDIDKAHQSIKKGQILAVSVFGTGDNQNSLKESFCNAACLAKEGGAQVIEANFSCPNVSSKEGCLYASVETTSHLITALVKAIKPLPLIIKVGVFPSVLSLKETLISFSRAGAQGVCGINTVSMRVVDKKGNPALGKTRLTSGICGGPIRKKALAFLQEAKKIIKDENLDLKLLGCGGITLQEHFDLFLEAGADLTLCATGMMWDPFLAMRWHELHDDK